MHRIPLLLVCSLLVEAGIMVPETSADQTNLFAAADTFIMEEVPNNNGGSSSGLAVGATRFGNVRRGLLQFDVTGLPSGAVVTSAVLRLEVTQLPGFTTPQHSNFALNPVESAWGEGTRIGNQGAAALTGDATWNNRMHPSTPWVTPGAGEFASGTSAASTFVSGLGAYTWTGAGLVAAIQSWVDNPGANHGWLLASESESTSATAKQFGSSESGSPPVLEVGYTVSPPSPDVLLTDIRVNTNRTLEIHWTGAPDWQYDLLATDELTGSGFALIKPNVRDSGTGTNVMTDLPLLANPDLPGNDRLAYALDARPIDPNRLGIVLDPVVTNLTAPVVLTHAGDGSGRLFVAEQTGQILIIDSNRTVQVQPFLDLSDKMTNLTVFGFGGVTDPGINPNYDERGLLGLAFHPDYTNNGRFFVYYSSPKTGTGINHESIVSEFTVSAGDPQLADASSERILLRQDQPEFNHNAGQLAFGPDGMLYIAFGDGGGGGDVHGATGNGQVVTNWLGAILRIDVDGALPYAVPGDNPFVGATGLDEIYAYGMRNPFRFSFDRSGEHGLIASDVGQNIYEEINLIVSGGNYGWRIAEGLHGFDIPLAAALGVDVRNDLVYPIHEYSHAEAGITVIGGFVYRGSQYLELVGKYVFGDFSDQFSAPGGRLYYLEQTRPGIWERFSFRIEPTDAPLGRFVKGFGEDEAGEIYLLASTALGPSGTTGEIHLLRRPVP